MDDPWGSPWAEETQFEKPIQEKGNDESSLTTRTPAKAAPLALTTNSPWDNDEEDDDGFGEWASVPAEQNGDLGFDTHDLSWERNGERGLNSPGLLERDLSPVWRADPSSLRPPKLALSPMPNHSLRQSSPDPWATEFALQDASSGTETERDGPVPEVGLTKQLSKKRRVSVSSVGESERDVTLPIVLSDIKTDEQQPLPNEAVEDRNETISNQQLPIAGLAHVSPRPSSSPSDGSQPDEEDGQHETPRTSMDDDPKRPQISRKTSSKVQPLVEHFDGLSKRDEEYSSSPPRDLSTSQKRDEVKEATVNEFGNFGEVEDKPPEDENIEREEPRELRSPTEVDASRQVAQPPTPEERLDRQSQTTSIPRVLKQRFDPIEIEVELSLLDELFPKKESKVVEDASIPDIVPYESFSSTEQRKTWYRISRYGSMQKHNSGDDENYARVVWPKSTIRDDTLKIVARWMEEDRFSGQVMLGGSGRTSTLFGWGDSKTPPASLASVFASRGDKRKSMLSQVAPSRLDAEVDVGKPSSPLGPKHRRSISSTKSAEDAGKPLSPIASFGWSSNTESKPESTNLFPPPSVTTDSTLSAQLPKATSTTSSVTVNPVQVPATIKPLESPQLHFKVASEKSSPTQTNFTNGNSEVSSNHAVTRPHEEDDEDWGDMISSPSLSGALSLLPQTQYSPPPGTSHVAADGPGITSSPANIHNEGIPLVTNSSKSGTVATSPIGVQITANAPPLAPSPNGWASADFSFFDSASISVPQTSSPATPLVSAKTVRPSPLKQVTFSKTLPSQVISSNSQIKEPSDQDRIVQGIIRNLPDFSYMLRK